MNKIYKVIYSKIKHCYIVVSELAKNQGKTKSVHLGGTSTEQTNLIARLRTSGATLAAVLAVAAIFSACPVMPTFAADATATGTALTQNGKDTENNTIVGDDNTALHVQADPDYYDQNYATRKGYTNMGNLIIGDQNAIGIFQHKKVDSNSGRMDTNSQKPGTNFNDSSLTYEKISTTDKTVTNPITRQQETISVNDTSKTGQWMYEDDTNKTDKTYDSELRSSYVVTGATVVGINSIAEGNNSLAAGNNAKVLNGTSSYYVDDKGKLTSDWRQAYYYLTQDGKKVNYNTLNNGGSYYTVKRYNDSSNAVALGHDVTVDGMRGVVIGDGSYGHSDSVVIGAYNTADSGAITQGYSNKARYHSVAMGTTNTADGYYDVALGENNTTKGNKATAIGYTNKATAENTVAIGVNNEVSTAGSVGIGDTNKISGTKSVSVGQNNTLSGNNAISVGQSNTSTKDNVIMVGQSTSVTENNGVAVGNTATVSAEGGVALGSGSTANTRANETGYLHEKKTASQADSVWTSTAGAVSVGGTSKVYIGATRPTEGTLDKDYFWDGYKGQFYKNVATTRQITNVAAGTQDTDAVNVAQLKAVADGVNIHDYSVNSDGNGDSNYNNTGATGDHALAAGVSAAAGSNNGIAIGNGAIAGRPQEKETQTGTIAIGTSTSVEGKNSIAIGTEVKVGEGITNSVVIGAGSTIGAGTDSTTATDYGVAIGGAEAKGSNTVAIGHGSAATRDNTVAIGHDAKAQGLHAIAIGDETHADTIGNVAIGYKQLSHGADSANNVSIGRETLVGDSGANNAIALGSYSRADIAAGKKGYDPKTNTASTETSSTWVANAGALSIGGGDKLSLGKVKPSGTENVDWYYDQSTGEYYKVLNGKVTRQIANVAAGTEDTDAVNVAQLKRAVAAATSGGAADFHDYSVNSVNPNADTNYKNGGATGKDAMAAGVNAKAIGEDSIAIGGATAIGKRSVAIGVGTRADGVGAVVVGSGNIAKGTRALAFGGATLNDTFKANTASGGASVAFGEGTKALALGSVAFGNSTQAGTDDGKAGQNSVAFGNETKATGGRSLAFGERTVAEQTNSVAFGLETKSMSAGSTAFGNRTRAIAEYATSMGNGAVAAGHYSVAFGTDTMSGAKIDEHGAIALQNGQKIDPNGYVAYVNNNDKTYSVTYQRLNNKGKRSGEIHDYVVLAGNDGKQYIRDYHGDIHEVTIGQDDFITVNDKALTDSVLQKPGEGGYYSAGYKIDGYQNSTAFGLKTKATNNQATAFGTETVASGENATAMGNSSVASGANSVAFGDSSTAAADNSLAALGGTVDAKATGSAAIGSGASVTQSGTVALGSGSVANRASGTTGYDPLTSKTSTATTDSTWTATQAAIAVGDADNNITRQITGVAAGSADTDAVNVAQLKQAETHYYSVNDNGIQKGNYTNDGATGEDALAAGVNTKAKGAKATVAGNNNTAYGANNTAVGSSVVTGGENTIAVGNNIYAGSYDGWSKDNPPVTGKNDVAVGNNILTSGENSVAIGNGAHAGMDQHYANSGDNTVAIGTSAQSQGSDSIAIGNKASASYNSTTGAKGGTSNISIGNGATTIQGSHNMAIGDNALVSDGENGSGNIAFGYGASVPNSSANNAIAIGTSSKVDGHGIAIGHSTIIESSSADDPSLAIGEAAHSRQQGGIVIGNGAETTNSGSNSIAIGKNSSTSGLSSIAIGESAKNDAQQQRAVAIGANSSTNVEGAVALGAYSIANTGKGVTPYVPDSATNQQKSDINATISTTGAVSVGGTQKDGTKVLRQITNVAAGSADSDAVNVAQLKAVVAASTSDGMKSFNVAGNGTQTAVIKDGNTVNFKDGTHTTAVTKAQANNAGVDVTFNVDAQGVVNDAQLPVVYTDASGNKVYKQSDGTFNTAKDGKGTAVEVGNVIASMNNGSDSTTTAMKLANVASSISDVGKKDDSWTTKLDTAAQNTPNNAVNVSDLKNTSDALTKKGLNFQGDNTGVTVNRKLGETLGIKGSDYVTTTGDANGNITVDLKQGTKDKIDNALTSFETQIDGTKVKTVNKDSATANFETGKNINLTNDNGAIKIATVETPSFTSVTTGDTVINNDGLTIKNGPTITKTKVDVNNQKITNVANGTENNDAVNVSQLNGSRTKITAGTNVESVHETEADGHYSYKIDADGASVSAGSTAVKVEAEAKDANNVTNYKVDLSDATKTQINNALTSFETQIDGTKVKTVDKDHATVNFEKGKNIEMQIPVLIKELSAPQILKIA